MPKKEADEQTTMGMESMEDLELSAEELALLGEMDAEPAAEPETVELPDAEPAAEPEPEPAPAPAAKAEPEPAAEPEPEPEPEREPERKEYSPSELLQLIERQNRDIAGLRADLIGERERRRLAENTEAPGASGEAGGDDDEIPIEEGRDGSYVMKSGKLLEMLRKQAGQGAQPAGPGSGADPQRRNQFELLRNQMIAESESPIEVGQAADRIEESVLWLDSELGKVLPEYAIELQQMPVGIGRVMHLMKKSGLQEQFDQKYPDLDAYEVSMAGLTLDKTAAERAMQTYNTRRKSGVGTTPAPKPAPAAAPKADTPERPRPMSRRGSARTETVSSARVFADMHPDEVLNLSDDDFAELERIATSE